jgi:hypothetical protein
MTIEIFVWIVDRVYNRGKGKRKEENWKKTEKVRFSHS